METESLGAEASGLNAFEARCAKVADQTFAKVAARIADRLGSLLPDRAPVYRQLFSEVNAGLLETQAQIEGRAQPALSDEAISLHIERDEANRLWRAQVPGIGDVGEASTLPNLLRLLADYLPRIGDAHGRDWHGYDEMLPCQMRGDYW